MRNSRFPGFYKLAVRERRRMLAESLDLESKELERTLDAGGMDVDTADKMIENVVGTYNLPFALTLNVRLNDRDYLAPMVVEEPSVVAAASNAAKIIREGGGFYADADAPLMIAQVQLDDVRDPEHAKERILQEKALLMSLADKAAPGLVARKGGCRDIEVRILPDDILVVHFIIDCRDAMGANLINTVAESVAPAVASLAQGKIGLRILSNLADKRLVRVRCAIPVSALEFEGHSGEAVRDGIVRASRFAELDPYRAATHNKGIMNGVDAVVIATGNDWRAVEAGAHAYAAHDGQYKPLCTWRKSENGDLVAALEMPLALGVVGGPSRVHQGALFGLKVSGVFSAQELAMLAASVGVASNFAALRALATVGIQRGHMALHARCVAIAAGARGELVEKVALRIHELGDVTADAARRELERLDPQFAAANPLPATSVNTD
jgi:hydroxymethylglutaryl-CoA reductase